MKLLFRIITCCVICFISFSCTSPTEVDTSVHIRLENSCEFDFDTVWVLFPVSGTSDNEILEVEKFAGFEKTDYFQFREIYTYRSVIAFYSGMKFYSLTPIGMEELIEPGMYTYKIGIVKVNIGGTSYNTLKLEFVKDQ